MTDYGVQPTGYVRKPLATILAELELAMVTEFGPGVIQNEESPLGQLNGLSADLLNEVDERNLELYQSYDPDQAEGLRLDMLGRLRVLFRGGRTDAEYRKAITNQGEARVSVKDIESALLGIPGVTFAKFWTEAADLSPGMVAIAVLGGDDQAIADLALLYVVPGINTFGSTRVTTLEDGQCRSFNILRPVVVPVSVELLLKNNDRNCPTPADQAIAEVVASAWLDARENGMEVTHYSLRAILEGAFPGVELVSFEGTRDSIGYGVNGAVPIAFTEIAAISSDDVGVDWS